MNGYQESERDRRRPVGGRRARHRNDDHNRRTDHSAIATVTLGGDVNLDHAAPASGFRYWKEWDVTQDGAGARVPSFRASNGAAATWPNDDEPDWAAQTAATETTVVAKVISASVVRMYLGG